MAEARDAGMDRADMISMVSDVYNPPPEAEPAPAADVVYDELPDGLIDLNTAAELHGCKVQTLRSWVKRGRLAPKGRLKSSAPGGGVILVDATEVENRVMSPPTNGRPRKVR